VVIGRVVCEGVAHPYLGARGCGAGCLVGAAAARSKGGQRFACQGTKEHAAGLSVVAGRGVSHPVSGGLLFEFVEDVVSAAADLAGDGEDGDLAAGPPACALVEGVVGALGAVAVLGGFDG
jgi:hypothetical protein